MSSYFGFSLSRKWPRKASLFVLLILLLCIYIVSFEKYIYSLTGIKNLEENVEETLEFRSLIMSEGSLERIIRMNKDTNIELARILTIWMLDNDFDLTNCSMKDYTLQDYNKSFYYKFKKKPEELGKLIDVYQSIWSDVKYFPIPKSDMKKNATVSYENSWLAERTYGGNRLHEGTDIMAGINVPELYPVVSVTEGTIEKIGWLNKGGWRIGIRSKSGAYFYYAHLSSYASGIEQGKNVMAGELLGFMGNTGYGPEGTVGNFDVHLHFGIYIKTTNHSELSVNPYWVLRYLEDNKLTYSY